MLVRDKRVKLTYTNHWAFKHPLRVGDANPVLTNPLADNLVTTPLRLVNNYYLEMLLVTGRNEMFYLTTHSTWTFGKVPFR